jgi:hypothetical protein
MCVAPGEEDQQFAELSQLLLATITLAIITRKQQN